MIRVGAPSRRRARPFFFMSEMAIDDRFRAAVGGHDRSQALSRAVIHRPGIIC
jgi:hypothetical protein